MNAPGRTTVVVTTVAVVVGMIAAGGFVGAISPSETTNGNYAPNYADISFVSFCNVGQDATQPEITSYSFGMIGMNGDSKVWEVTYTATDEPDYVILKGGNVGTSPNGYLLRIDDPTSPVSVTDGNAVMLDADFPQDFGPGNACLAGDTGVKYDYGDT